MPLLSLLGCSEGNRAPHTHTHILYIHTHRHTLTAWGGSIICDEEENEHRESVESVRVWTRADRVPRCDVWTAACAVVCDMRSSVWRRCLDTCLLLLLAPRRRMDNLLSNFLFNTSFIGSSHVDVLPSSLNKSCIDAQERRKSEWFFLLTYFSF